jgi:hypothetical protein
MQIIAEARMMMLKNIEMATTLADMSTKFIICQLMLLALYLPA